MAARRPRRVAGPGAGRLRELQRAVQDFVRAAGLPPPPAEPGPAPPSAAAGQARRNRRELRKQKRRLKRGRRRLLQREPGGAQQQRQPPPAPAPAPAPDARPQQKQKQPVGRGKPEPLGAVATARARKRALLAANEAEEREIRRLERCLRLRKRRRGAGEGLPPSFARDGLGYVLGALGGGAGGLWEDGESDGGGEAERGLAPGGSREEDEDELQSEEEEEDEEELEDEGAETGTAALAKADTTGPHEASSADGGTWEPNPAGSPMEQTNLCPSPTKYVPPQARGAGGRMDDKKREELLRLKKTVNGLVNRLSEPNMASISGQLEELYMANSRKDMNETLTDILMNACVAAAAMPARLMMEHVLLVSILHHTVGIEVGAHFLEAVVKKFDELYTSETEGKECENLFILIAHLYNFRVVHSLLIFDILKKLVSTFTEKDIELILLLLKNVGFSLRKDDASALKELISEAQNKASAVGKKFQDQSRVHFMLETMLALKNNDMRKIPGYDPEPVEKLRKLQRPLVHNSGSGRETQLRVSLESLLNADQVGRWWIIGSSWSGAPMIDNTNNKTQQQLPVGKVSSKILELARKQRMNTDIRKNIFCVLMTSEDFLDAFEKLLKLGLKDQQEREIVHVLLDCCLQEKTYNPFYAYLAAKFCEYDRRFQMTFQFSFWDKIRDLGNLSPTAFSNLVCLLVHVLKTKSLSISVLKVIEFSELDKPKVRFLRQVLSMLLIKTDSEELSTIFGRLSDNPKLGMLREGLKLFLSHFLLKNVQVHTSAEKASLLKERVELVSRTLQAKESRLKL